jgi:MFS family permease
MKYLIRIISLLIIILSISFLLISPNYGYASSLKEGENLKIETGEKIDVPFFGEITINDYSLPILTIVFGLTDGINPWAMWILLILINVLIGIKDRKKMFILGFTFILSSALVYYLLMTVWLKIFLSIGFIFWIRLLIILLALISGYINIKLFLEEPETIESEEENKFLERINKFIKEKSFFLALLGVILLAFPVNLFEFLCSAGFPLLYTETLILSEVSTLKYHLYLLLYVFLYILDHIIVFTIAMITLKITKIPSKYLRLGYLIGGLLMLMMALLFIYQMFI